MALPFNFIISFFTTPVLPVFSSVSFIQALLFQASELSDKRGNTSPNSSAAQVPQKSDGSLVSPVPSVSSAASQRLTPGMMQHALDQNSGNGLNDVSVFF